MLGPLSTGAVREMVRGQLDVGAEESFCRAVSELGGGNPLFVRELLAAAREEGLPARSGSLPVLQRIAPRAVGSSVLARLGRLDAESVALARAVAVLGAGAEVVVAARLARMDADVAELAADRLAAAQILASVRPLEFFHPLIGAAVLESIAPGARRVAHRRAAELVDTEAEGSLPRVAAHLLACGPATDRWVVQRLADAAREALERGAPEVAASYARRALAEPPGTAERAAVLLSLGTAEWRAGQPDAITHLEQALAAAGDDHRALVSASDLLVFAYYVTDQAERGVEVRERTLAAVGDTDARLAVRLEASAALVGMTNERTAPAAIRRAEGLHRCVRTLRHPPVALLVTLALDASRANRADEAQELAERVLACEPYPPPLWTINPLMNALMVVECYDRLQQLSEGVLKSARQRGAIQELAGISAWRAAGSYDCGALADAEADARWGLEHGAGLHRIRAVADLTRVLIERDELQEAEDVINQTGDPRGSRSIDVPRFLFARGQLRRAQGRLREALDDFLEAGQRYDRVGQVRRSSVQWSEVALVHAGLGNAGEARRLAVKQLALARAAPRPRMLGISLRVCGLIEGGDTGLELLAESGQDAGALAVTAGAEPRPNRLRRGTAPRRPPRPSASATRAGARSRPPLRRPADRRLGAHGADRRRRQAQARRDHRPRRADRRRATRREARRRWTDQPRNRPGPVYHHEDSQGAPQPRVPQARDHPPRPTRRGAHRPSRGETRGCRRYRSDFLIPPPPKDSTRPGVALRARPSDTAPHQATNDS